MPELPEVETVVRTLAPHVLGSLIASARLLLPASLHPQSMPLKSLVGMRIGGARRRGKLILLDLEPGPEISPASKNRPSFLVFHLRMTGRLFTSEANRQCGKHCRCLFGLRGPDDSRKQLFFDDTRTFGKIMAATPEILDAWPFWREMGPEPLEIDPDVFASRLRGNRQIKAALLDQKVLAGIGNIYADEALFQAGLHPARAANSLDLEESGKLLAAIKDVLSRSIAQCGSSIRDYRDADGNVGAFQNSFKAYGRGGEKCSNCGSTMRKTRIGGRATVFCPVCQK